MSTSATNTAREALTAFLDAWKAKDWTAMEQSAQMTWRSVSANGVAGLRAMYSYRTCVEYEIEDGDGGPVVGLKNDRALRLTARVKLSYAVMPTDEPIRRMSWIVICEVAPFDANPDGTWGVNPASERVV